MSTNSFRRPAVITARDELVREREKLKLQHAAGSPGIQVCAHLSDLFDTVVLDLYHAALDELKLDSIQSQIALVPHGGYGRRDVAPFSDVDLMLLHTPRSNRDVEPLARRLAQSIFDVGLQLGFSLRTPSQACSLALQDPAVFTSLAESRFMGGSVQLFSKFMRRFRRDAHRKSATLIAAIEKARREERRQYGDVVYLLKPNIKRSRGCLRDLQLLRWIGFARYGESEPETLVRLGFLSKDDHRKLRRARAFILHLRNEMHFHAGKSQDVLDKSEQVRLAEWLGYKGDEAVLPVEEFMREYFAHTSNVRYCVAHFVASSRVRSPFVAAINDFLGHRIGRDFRVGPVHISATRTGLKKVTTDLGEVLRLMDLANRYNKRISHETWEAIRTAMIDRKQEQLSADVCDRFLSLLSQPGRLADLLRRLHELRVLEQIIPAVKHARGLIQFNEYHKYTVDAHSIRAVQHATEFQDRNDELGEAYRGIRDKTLLHFALLLHDLGKGFSEDHSDVGLQIATETADRLNLDRQDIEILQFLVHKHLLMAHVAFRQNLNDEAAVIDFSKEVGSPGVLDMLFVLTCADLAAVGPGVLNDWKLKLLCELYNRTLVQIAGDTPPQMVTDRLTKRRNEILEIAATRENSSWWERQIASLPRGYLFGQSPKTTVEELRQLENLPRNDAVAWGRYKPDRSVVEYTVGAHEEICPGVFHRLTGALTSMGMHILTAEIHTLADNLVLDRFYVSDLDFSDEPPQSRFDEVCETLTQSLKKESDHAPTFRRVWSADESAPLVNQMPTRIRFDNRASDKYTIVTVFAYDCMGLLYAVSRMLFDLGLSVHVAKIGTYVDQVCDVFYVNDAQGQKVVDNARLENIHNELLAAVERVQVRHD